MPKGGNHLLNENDIFSFDLNESLYFQKGQEVAEMLSISLEPEISIQSFKDYVSIRGVIELQGEYLKDVSKDEQTRDLSDVHENQSWRYLEKVADKDEHHALFSHRFPVEISVPSYRVANMDDISVSIETFDYELPERHQLLLTSTIEIFGISNQEAVDQTIQEKTGENAKENMKENKERSFEFELKKQGSDEHFEIVPEETTANLLEGEVREVSKIEGTPESEQTHADDDRWKYKQIQSIDDFLKKDELIEKDQQEVKHEEIAHIEAIAPNENDHFNQEGIEVIEKDTKETTANVIEEMTEERPEEITEERPGNINYLDGLFDHEESDEKYTKMRIYIVQETDTLEIISSRYQIPKLQLLKQNRLDDDDLSAGQLLSIPANKEKKV